MGKYAYVKLGIILYHKQTDLSIGFAKVFLKKLCKSPPLMSEGLEFCYIEHAINQTISDTPSSQARSFAPRSRRNRYRAKW